MDSEQPSWSLSPWDICGYRIVECPRCFALVEYDSTDQHDAWHEQVGK